MAYQIRRQCPRPAGIVSSVQEELTDLLETAGMPSIFQAGFDLIFGDLKVEFICQNARDDDREVGIFDLVAPRQTECYAKACGWIFSKFRRSYFLQP